LDKRYYALFLIEEFTQKQLVISL